MQRLERETPWGAQVGCALAIGLVLCAVGGPILWLAKTHHEPFSVTWIVGGGFALFGVIVILSGIHQSFARATPETIVELEEPSIARGGTIALRVRQPGPVNLQSLRVNVICLEVETRRVRRSNGTHTEQFSKQIHDQNVLDVRDVDVAPGDELLRECAIELPPDVPRTGRMRENVEAVWKIEVWGRVRGRADFMHPFVVTVE